MGPALRAAKLIFRSKDNSFVILGQYYVLYIDVGTKEANSYLSRCRDIVEKFRPSADTYPRWVFISSIPDDV